MLKSKLTYNKVFDKYYESLSDKLSNITYLIYKYSYIKLEKFLSLSKEKKDLLTFADDFKETSVKMPSGFDYIENKTKEGFLNLRYIDLFDYLPKENIDLFIKELQKFDSKNKKNFYGRYFSERDKKERLEYLKNCFDTPYFYRLMTIDFSNNEYLEKYSPSVTISLYNLSSTFVAVRYRIHIHDEFNKSLNKICKKEYGVNKYISREFNVPWYKPNRFAEACSNAGESRYKNIYNLISELKWKVLLELRKFFTIYFFEDKIFPPSFETYFTNIQLNEDSNLNSFWHSVTTGIFFEYSKEHNIYLTSDYEKSSFEGTKIAEYHGENYSEKNILQDIEKNGISDNYAIYLVASTLCNILDRDITFFNKNISKAIRGRRSNYIFKVKLNIEKNIYYPNRFISEFSGNTIIFKDLDSYKSIYNNDISQTEQIFDSVVRRVKETKKKVDIIINMLSDASELRTNKLTIQLQLLMMIVTLLSLIIAVFSIDNDNFKQIIDLLKGLF